VSRLRESRALAPLRRREFRLLFLARVVSFLGSAMAPVALAFAVLDLTGSKADLGFVLAARILPSVVLMLAGGVVADRLPRHQVMVWSNVISGAAQAVLAALLLSGHARIWHLLVLAAVNGASGSFFFPASAAVVPQVVDADIRQQGNALLRLGITSTTIFGAAVGGLIVAAASPGAGIAVDAGTFLLAAAITARMRLPAVGRAAETGFVRELREGWREFAGRTWLWVIVAQFAFVNAAESGTMSVLGPVVAKEHLHGALGWGIVLAFEAAGFVLAGLVMLRLHPPRLLLTATLGFLLTTPVLAGLAIPLPLPAVAALALLAGLGAETFGVMWDTTMQQEIPEETLSRVYSYDALGSLVLMPIGYVVVGPLAAVAGTGATLWGAFALNTAVTLAVLGVADVRRLRRHTPAPAPAV
jgi:MFS family permease